MAQTAKNVLDDIFELATRFGRTDDSRLDEDYIYYKMNQIRADLIVKQYNETKILDMTWLTDCGLLTFYKVNKADNNAIACTCDIAKTTVPQTISLQSKDGNLDLGVYSLTSSCGKYGYYPKSMFRWSNTPAEHSNSLFKYYFRINTSMYVSDTPTQLRMVGILLDPTEGYLINSASVASGSLANGTVYYVANGTVIYNSAVYNSGSTFTANATTTFTGTGTVYLNVQAASYRDVDPYPASGEMIRQIVLEILTKEFNIEAHQLADVKNDSTDDTKKQAG